MTRRECLTQLRRFTRAARGEIASEKGLYPDRIKRRLEHGVGPPLALDSMRRIVTFARIEYHCAQSAVVSTGV